MQLSKEVNKCAASPELVVGLIVVDLYSASRSASALLVPTALRKDEFTEPIWSYRYTLYVNEGIHAVKSLHGQLAIANFGKVALTTDVVHADSQP